MLIAGGWLMVPLLLASVLAFALVLERLWTLRADRIAPPQLLDDVWQQLQAGPLSAEALARLRADSPLGQLLAAGVENARAGRELMKERIEDAAEPLVHEMERNLTVLGTIALISPLLGLLGTVVGIIEAFTAATASANVDPALLGAGISKALITTAAGLLVAIPAMVMHRHFIRHITTLTVRMERQAVLLVDRLHGDA